MGVTAVGKNNAGLNASASTFAKSTVVELIGRPYINVFHLDRLIFLNIDFYITLMPFPNNFVCQSAAFAANTALKNYKLVIHSINLIILTKQLTSTALKAHIKLIQLQNMRHYYSRVQIKLLSIYENQTSIDFDNVFTTAFPDMVIVGQVATPTLRAATRGTNLILKILALTASNWSAMERQCRAAAILRILRTGKYKGLHNVFVGARVRYWQFKH